MGNPENKKSGTFSYEITPVLYEEKPFEIVESGKLKIFSFNKKSFSVGISIDKENEEYFKKIERRITDLYDDLEVTPPAIVPAVISPPEIKLIARYIFLSLFKVFL